jgi:hypothetical protein
MRPGQPAALEAFSHAFLNALMGRQGALLRASCPRSASGRTPKGKLINIPERSLGVPPKTSLRGFEPEVSQSYHNHILNLGTHPNRPACTARARATFASLHTNVRKLRSCGSVSVIAGVVLHDVRVRGVVRQVGACVELSAIRERCVSTHFQSPSRRTNTQDTLSTSRKARPWYWPPETPRDVTTALSP